MKTIFSDFISLIYPEYCYGCGNDLEKGEEKICTECRFSMPKIDLEKENILAKKLWGKVPVEYVFAYLKFIKTGRIQRLMHNLKYNNKPEIGEILGNWFGTELLSANLEKKIDLIIPIPLHTHKLKKRGYNQSDKIAMGMSETMNIPWSAETISRKIHTETQTRKKRYERFENAENIFSVNKPEELHSKHVLIVDDILTTGSTFEACVKAVKDSGAEYVSIAALAAS